jgi:hypothetical protein
VRDQVSHPYKTASKAVLDAGTILPSQTTVSPWQRPSG